MEIRVRKSQYGNFLERLNILNKKLTKYGQTASVESTRDIEISFIDAGGSERKVKAYLVTLSSPKILHVDKEVYHIGTISFDNGIKQIYATENCPVVLGDIPTEKLTCDHCHVNRFRTKYFFFEEAGKILSIGSSCAKEYFGMDIERYLDKFVWLLDILESEFGGLEKGPKFYNNLDDVIVAASCATNRFTSFWVSKAKVAWDQEPTSSIVRSYLFPPVNDYGQELKDKFCKESGFYTASVIADIKAKLIERWKITPSNDFEWNVVNNLFYDDGDLRDEIVGIGVVSYALYSVLYTKPAPKEGEVPLKSGTVGTIGEKFQAHVIVYKINTVDSYYGPSLLVTFKTDDGHLVKTFSTSAQIADWKEGEEHTIKGTIKQYNEYNGFESTLLKRVTEVKAS